MKRTIYLLLLCMAGVLFSCSEDDSLKGIPGKEKAETGYKRSVISFQDMKTKLSESPGKSLTLFSDIAHKGGDGYILEIDSTYIIEYSNDTLTTYTMKVSTLDDGNYSFSNLIIKLSGGETEEYVAHYSPSEAWQEAHDSGEYLPYEGELALVDLNGEETLPQGKMTTCTISLEPTWTCSEGNPHPPGHPRCVANSTSVTGYIVTVSCSTSGGSSGGGTGGPGDPGDNPPPGGGMPTDPIGGDNGSGMGNTPCGTLNHKRLDAEFQSKIQHLKSLLNSSDENGFFNYNPSEVQGQQSTQTNKYNIMASKTGADGLKKVRAIFGVQVFGFMHTHPIHEKIMGVHSTGDIHAFMEILLNRDAFGYSLSDAYGIVVGSHGIYSLKLEDSSKFYAWCAEYSGNDSVSKARRKKYFDDFEEQYKKVRIHENARTNNERSVLKMLDQYYNELGVGIYRAVESNNSITGWQRMSLDSNRNPKFTNCN